MTLGKNWIRKIDSKLVCLSRGEAKTRETQQTNAFSVESPYPTSFWSAALVTGFLGWIGSIIGLIMVTFRQGEVRGSRARYGLGAFFLCFILWLVGMTKA